MAFDWREYKTLAVKLSGVGDEASKRSAISRGYYFAYHLALARAMANQYLPTTYQSVHKQLWTYYENASNLECRRVALIGKRMKRKRGKADYDDDYPRLDDEVISILSDATQCETILSALPAGVP
jgi:uncharacterized protein (UPF0332 family)